MSTEQRPSGYFWVIYDNKEWEVARYDHIEMEWRRINNDHSFVDWEFDEIDETPIIRKEQ